ncbi:hypothetical protein ABBQ32_007870 [Trebouxia sp. C0010 RCD-2024]
MPAEPDWKVPHTSTTCRSASPTHLDLDPSSSTEDLTASANPNLNGIDPARAKWSERPMELVQHLLQFQQQSAQLAGCSGKSDGLESMRDVREFLPDLEDMDADQPDVPEGL